jgi:hypothetical protein
MHQQLAARLESDSFLVTTPSTCHVAAAHAGFADGDDLVSSS